MPSTFAVAYSPNYKPTLASHRSWGVGVIGNGDSWPRIIPGQITSSTQFYRLGIIPTYVLTAPTTTASGTSTAGTYGIVLVYRSNLFFDGLSGEDIQSNRSNIVDVTLTSADAAVLTKVTIASDTKVDALDIYAAQKISGVYGSFYRVVQGCANSAGTVTFNILMTNGFPVGGATSEGTIDASNFILAEDNDYPQAQPILIEVNGRLVAIGGLTKTLTCTFTNGSPTITTTETIYDGIEFWNLQRDGDTSGGINALGTYYVRYATANSLSIVDASGVSANYTGTTGSGTATCWTEPNRKASKPLNPHAWPAENINNDYPSAAISAGKVPNTNRILIMGKDWTIAEDYDPLPVANGGLNYISTEYGCQSPFSVVSARGRLYWLDFSKGKREIIVSDGSTCQPISTRKIKTILQQITLDSNGDPWRILFIHGAYFRNDDTIRWGLYMDDNTVPNYVLELDLTSGDLRNDPVYYGHRYLDAFTYGQIRGKVFIGQYGWSGGTARLGIDNVPNRFIDWAPSGTVSGDLDTTGQTTTVLTDTAAAFLNAGDKLAGIQVLIWRDTDANGDIIINPTYYHCRISTNTATTFTINYVETCNSIGQVQSIDVSLPSAPSGAGWQYRIGIIQGVIGPKWFTSKDANNPMTFRQLSMTHHAYDTGGDTPVRFQGHENFDTTPTDAQDMEPTQQGQQLSDSSMSSSSFAIPKTNPAPVLGATVIDNNSNFDTTSLNIETFTVDYNDQIEQEDQGP